jgi:hypothetical protein
LLAKFIPFTGCMCICAKARQPLCPHVLSFLQQWGVNAALLFLQEPTDIAATYPELIGGLLSLIFCCWYYAKKHWLANNILGICFSVEGIEHLSLGSVQTGAILLSGLFFYDIFWVFCTPVMVQQPARLSRVADNCLCYTCPIGDSQSFSRYTLRVLSLSCTPCKQGCSELPQAFTWSVDDQQRVCKDVWHACR